MVGSLKLRDARVRPRLARKARGTSEKRLPECLHLLLPTSPHRCEAYILSRAFSLRYNKTFFSLILGPGIHQNVKLCSTRAQF